MAKKERAIILKQILDCITRMTYTRRSKLIHIYKKIMFNHTYIHD